MNNFKFSLFDFSTVFWREHCKQNRLISLGIIQRNYISPIKIA